MRINLDGVVDDTFNIGSAASGVIMDIDVDSADRIIVVGDLPDLMSLNVKILSA